MKRCLKSRYLNLCILYLLFAGCGVTKNSIVKPIVPIIINIQSDAYQLAAVNFNIYAFKVVDRLEEFNEVDLKLVDEADSATIILDINIDQYNAFPPEERISRKVFNRAIQAGTDASGKPVYRTISASADIVSTRTRTSASFNTNLLIKGTPGKTFKRTFSENLNIDNLYVTNIQGDSRAIDPSVYRFTMPPMEPYADDILLTLSNKEMLERLSREIRSYYAK